jgi:hypothetical protein
VGEELQFRVAVVDGTQLHAPGVALDQPCPKVTVNAVVVGGLVHNEAENVGVVQVHGGVRGPDMGDDALVAGRDQRSRQSTTLPTLSHVVMSSILSAHVVMVKAWRETAQAVTPGQP